ncbi:MAG: acetate--CoA ligase family protein [Bacillota bacterium]
MGQPGADLIQMARAEGRHLLEPEAALLCQAFGLPLPAWRWVHDQAQALEAAADLKSPLVLKLVSRDILHKSDVGGVKLGVTKGEMTAAAFAELASIAQARKARFDGVLVCQQAPAGLELVAGMVQDPEFGPALMFGLGGTAVELFGDVAFGSVPVTPARARHMIASTRAGKLLSGYRGACLDLEAITAVLTGLSRLVEAHPEIQEIDLNPVRAYQSGALILDIRILL